MLFRSGGSAEDVAASYRAQSSLAKRRGEEPASSSRRRSSGAAPLFFGPSPTPSRAKLNRAALSSGPRLWHKVKVDVLGLNYINYSGSVATCTYCTYEDHCHVTRISTHDVRRLHAAVSQGVPIGFEDSGRFATKQQ